MSDPILTAPHRIRPHEQAAVERLIERHGRDQADRDLLAQVLGFVEVAPTPVQSTSVRWCDRHQRERLPRAQGNGYRCSRCEHEATLRRRMA